MSQEFCATLAEMKSCKPFFTPAAKKCKYREETSLMDETDRSGSTFVRRNDSFDQGTDVYAARNLECSFSNPSEVPLDMRKPMSVQLEHKHRIENSSTPTCDQGNSSCNVDPSLQEPLFSVSSAVGRRWHSLRRRCYHWQRSQNFSFKVVSYNVLADGLLHANSHLYTGTEPWVQLWEYRKRNLLQEILHYDADVVCLQEVEDCHYDDWFEPKLRERGYTGLFKKRTGNKTDGCATFFKKSRFTLVKSKLLSFRKPGIKLMDRDNVAVVVLLKPKTMGRASRQRNNMVCVSNTHLLFNNKRGDIKLAQLACLFAEIDEIAGISSPEKGGTHCSYHPIICCGDFNSTPHSPIYNFVVRGFLDYGEMHRDNISGQNHYRSSYPSWQAFSSNIIPWDLGITSSCVKRKNHSETTGDLLNFHEEPQATSTRNCASGSEVNHPKDCDSQIQSSKDDSLESRLVVNGSTKMESWESPWEASLSSVQHHASQNTTSCSPHSVACATTTFLKGGSATEPQQINSLSSKGECQEGEQTGCQSMVNTSERNLHEACTVLQHAFNFFSVYRHHFRNGQPEVTTFHDRACTTVDFMFVSSGLRQQCHRCESHYGPLQMTGNLELLSEEHIWSLGGLPNRFLSSDHLALVSSFLLHV